MRQTKTAVRIVLLAVFLLLASSSVLAECPPDCPEQPAPLPSTTFNPADPSSFDYASGDYSTITEWSKVEWSKIPIRRIPEVPADQLQYTKLTVEQRREMSTEQIAVNLERIDNLAQDVNEGRAREAIEREKSVRVLSLGKSAHLENNVLRTTFDEEVGGEEKEKGSFDFSGKGMGWEIKVDELGIVRVIKPAQINEESISAADKFTLAEKTAFTSKAGFMATVTALSFEQGKSYVKQGETATIDVDNDGIDDYSIPADKNAVGIYFDPAIKAEGNYVAVSEKGLAIGSVSEGTVTVTAQPGNTLFNMVKRDYSTTPPTLVPSERDSLSMTVSGGDEVEIVSRVEQGKTPLLKHHEGKGQMVIDTGRMSVMVAGGDLFYSPPEAFPKSEPIDLRNSVALELVSDSKNFQQETVRMSSSNRLVMLHNGQVLAGNSQGLEVSDLLAPNQMKTVADLKAKYPQIEFYFGDYGEPTVPDYYTDITAGMAQTVDEWLHDKPGIERYIPALAFNTIDNAGAVPLPRGIELGERAMDPASLKADPIRKINTLETIDHEFVHLIGAAASFQELGPLGQSEREIDAKFFQQALDEAKTEGLNIDDPAFALPPDLQRQMDQKQVRAYEALRSQTLGKKYEQVALALAERIYSNRQFNNMMDEVDEFLRSIGEPERAIAVEVFQGAAEEDLTKKIKAADWLNKVEATLKRRAEREQLPEERREKAQELLNRFTGLVARQTGLYPYSFTHSQAHEFGELPATYHELPPEQAGKLPELRTLAQFELDTVMSTNPPAWLREQAEERYYQILGGRDSPYCREHLCGACLEYTLTCKP